MGLLVQDGQIGIRLKTINRYGFKALVFESGVVYVIEDRAERQRLISTGFFELVDLDPAEYVIVQSKNRDVAVLDPFTAAKLTAMDQMTAQMEAASAVQAPAPKKSKAKGKPKIKTKPRDTVAGEGESPGIPV